MYLAAGTGCPKNLPAASSGPVHPPSTQCLEAGKEQPGRSCAKIGALLIPFARPENC